MDRHEKCFLHTMFFGHCICFHACRVFRHGSQVIYTMPEDIYEDIVDSLRMQGHEPSDEMIADFYIDNY